MPGSRHAFVIVALLTGCSRPVPKPVVPASLQVPPNTAKVILRAPARGVQIYKCTGDATAGFAWTLTAPDATLFDGDDMKNSIGHHFAGPTWELNDSSKVVGKVLQKAASPDTGAVPWLLLQATTTSGSGVLTRAGYIQRVQTSGGVAPSTGCDASTPGAEARVDYTAVYYFWGSP
jgi:hypothetical protein